MTFTQVVKDEAYRLGFALAGVTTPDPPPHLPVYENWLAMGRHASMTYLTDPRRREPARLLPGCKSILALGMCYPAPAEGEYRPGEGRISSYAWGRDYHLVIAERLKMLAGFIEEQAQRPVGWRGYTDSGPLLERALAQRAGLGWIGRNNCLIHPRLGSYFFLAELLLDVELEPDPPFMTDRCGRCTRCLDACPTGCLLPDRTMDARRCISYLTIENRGEIPPELRPLMGNWIFGCDICQQVCPWNRRPLPAPEPAFVPPGGPPSPRLTDELRLSPQEFQRKFKDSPIRRAHRGGYLRNVAVALGNCGEQSDLPALEQAMTDSDPLVRQHAAWGRERILERHTR